MSKRTLHSPKRSEPSFLHSPRSPCLSLCPNDTYEITHPRRAESLALAINIQSPERERERGEEFECISAMRNEIRRLDCYDVKNKKLKGSRRKEPAEKDCARPREKRNGTSIINQGTTEFSFN